MKTPNEQISEYIDKAVQGVISFVTEPSNVQVELTFLSLAIIMTFFGYVILTMIDNAGGHEYIDFEYEDED